MSNQALLQDDIFQILGLQNMPEDRKLAMLAKISDLVLKRICLRVMDELKDKDDALKAKAEDIFTNGTDEEKLDFIQQNMDLVTLMRDEIVKVKEDLLNDLRDAGLAA